MQTRKKVMASMGPIASLYVSFKSHETAPEDCEFEDMFRRRNRDILVSDIEDITQRPTKFGGDSEIKDGVINTAMYLLRSAGKIIKATHPQNKEIILIW